MTSNFWGHGREPNLYYGKTPIISYPAGMIMPKNRPWRNEVNWVLDQIVAMGIDIKLNTMFDIPQRKRSQEDLESLNLEQLSTAFFLLVVGLALAAISFVFEVLNKRAL